MMIDEVLVTIAVILLIVLTLFGNWIFSALFNKAQNSVRGKLDQHAQKREDEEQPDGERLADRYKDIEK